MALPHTKERCSPPGVTTEAVYTSDITIPGFLQDVLSTRAADAPAPNLVKVKRRVDRALAQVIALAPEDGGGVVLNFEDGGTLFGFQFRQGQTITAHGVTPQRLRLMLLVACEALAKAEEIINTNRDVQA